ncbi:uncharacterized protein F4807DRAFT_178975 [Annulohypoxylon truncatum]|uniref:uncharacterized protein n=1 Tax=Annulohypoxylon truncatum TaxID=327061 RepID=UPI0020088D97|nr:uncharacterized protein F4807DRAFT_178975 [Annulohypoxylon truncatum]KAI1207474.1 hypothetical protein F4807DRAFT_178975 [Annulohypoxylon truncatum]
MAHNWNIPPKSPHDLPAFLNHSSGEPPHGIIQHIDNPPNANGGAIVLAVICLLLTTAAFLLRAYARFFVLKKFYIEDLLGLCAFGCYIGTICTYFLFLRTIGFFVHMWDTRWHDLIEMASIAFVLNIIYQLNQLFVKVSILLEWARIFTPDHGRSIFFWASRVLICAAIIGYTGGIVITVVRCVPVVPIWRFYVTPKCLIQKERVDILCIFNISLDTFILILPQWVIWKLQISRKRKLGVSLVFSIGILACICAAGRLGALVYADDSSYFVSLTLVWMLAEETCALLVFCVPSVPKAFDPNNPRSLVIKHPWTHLFSRFRSRPTPEPQGNTYHVWMPLTRAESSPLGSMHAYRTDEEAQTQVLAEPNGIHMKQVNTQLNSVTEHQSHRGDEVSG